MSLKVNSSQRILSHCSIFSYNNLRSPRTFLGVQSKLPLAAPLLSSGRAAFISHKAAQTLDKLHLKCEEAQRPHRLTRRNLRLIQFADTHQSKHQAQIAECSVGGGRRTEGACRCPAIIIWSSCIYKP